MNRWKYGNPRLVCGWLVALIGLLSCASASGQATGAASPEAFLGRPVGTDFELADWEQVSGYYRELADASRRVELTKVGETTEGRDFLIAVISSEANLERIEEIKGHARMIADPRGKSESELRRATRDGKVIVFVTPSMHSTEVAATEMGMRFAWMLATSDEQPWKSAREETVVVITPSLNPDGVDHVVEWYREHVGTNLEGTSLDKLYQFYTGHDNNRDWFMLTQTETRHLTRLLYQEWFPQILWDVHQQGNSKERFFVPPYRDPLNPNLDAGIVAGINLIGTRAVMDMTREGFTGIATGVSYDNWWNGGNRSVPCRHNVIGILTEAASAKYASPIFQEVSSLRDPLGSSRYQPSNQFLRPWAGGWWRVSDIIDYELAFGRSLLGSVSREPRFWLTNALEAAKRNIDSDVRGGPRGWLIPIDNPDRGATRRMIDVLLASGVEVHVAEASFEADGREFPAGTIVLRRDQPYGGYVQDLFELQDFPPGTNPYDVTGWTLPLLLGVRRVEVTRDFSVSTRPVSTPEEATEAFAGDPRLGEFGDGTGEESGNADGAGGTAEVVSLADSDGWIRLIEAVRDGGSARVRLGGEGAGLAAIGGERDDDASSGESVTRIDAMPRIGVYAPWAASMDEGWLRWVLDEFDVPFQRIRNETIRDGQLHELVDVLILPSVTRGSIDRGRSPDGSPREISGGLDPEGALAVQRFVRGGGRLITLGSSSAWAIDLFGLPLTDVTRGNEAGDFSCPGSILRGVVEPHALTAGLPGEISLFFSRSSGWKRTGDSDRDAEGVNGGSIKTLLRYAPNRLLLSGFIRNPETLEGSDAWVVAECGEGEVHLFGFRPHYRAWTQATFHLLFRSIFLATPVDVRDAKG